MRCTPSFDVQFLCKTVRLVDETVRHAVGALPGPGTYPNREKKRIATRGVFLLSQGRICFRGQSWIAIKTRTCMECAHVRFQLLPMLNARFEGLRDVLSQIQRVKSVRSEDKDLRRPEEFQGKEDRKRPVQEPVRSWSRPLSTVRPDQ